MCPDCICSWDEPDERLRLTFAAAVTALVGYLGHRYIRVAHCQDEGTPKDELDQALKKVHLKVQEAQDEAKRVVDAKVEELWMVIKDKYVSKAAREAFDVVEKICGTKQ